jgi:hypothetical protein
MSRRNKTRQIVWHYTYSHNIEAILQSGVLLPPIMCLHFNTPQNSAFGMAGFNSKAHLADAKLLLFSEREDWEPTSYRAVACLDGTVIPLHKLEDYAEHGFSVFRIGVPRSILHPWLRLKEMVKMPREMGRALENTARVLGSNPYQWWGTAKPITMDQWRAVEIWNPDPRTWVNCVTAEEVKQVVR